MIRLIRYKGGPGSGHKGHKGIPGHQGGSLPEELLSNNFIPGTPASLIYTDNINKNGVIHLKILKAPIQYREDDGRVSYEQPIGAVSLTYLGDDIRQKIKDNLVTDISNILINKGNYPVTKEQAYADVNQIIKNWAMSANDTDIRALATQYAASLEFGIPLSEWQKEQFANVGGLVAIETMNIKSDQADEVTLLLLQYNQDSDAALFISQEKGDEVRQAYEKNVEELNQRYVERYKNNFFSPDKAWKIAEGISRHAEATIGQYGKNYYRSTSEGNYNLSISKQREILRAMYENTQETFAKVGMKPDDTVVLYRGFNSQSLTNIENTRRGDKVDFIGNVMESWSTEPSVAQQFATSKGVTAHTHEYVIGEQIPIKNIIGTARTGFGCINEYEVVPLGNIPGTKVRVIFHQKT